MNILIQTSIVSVIMNGFQLNAFDNIILLCDSYKVSHYSQYPAGTETIYSYFESRGGKFPNAVFFGLQYIIKRNLVGQVVTHEKIDEAKSIFLNHFGRDIFNEKGWRYIADHHKGHLPIVIKAVPEGMIVPIKNVLMTVENTDPKCYWLTNYLETILVQVWYPIAVATNSRAMKQIIAKYLHETADDSSTEFKLHDFGFRGVSSIESAAIGGTAHLVNFRGTDSLAALILAREYYNCPTAGFSIPATEHSAMTVWGEENETNAYSNLFDLYPTGTFACVSDSYDIWKACSKIWGETLRDKVLNRHGTVVIRPDSGDPVDVMSKVLDLLGAKFGYTVNSKGYKVLPSCIRVIQGDGVSLESLDPILNRVKTSGWSTENVSFGSGGALLQRLNRDTQKCAFKCSFAVVNGHEIQVSKHPITDPQKNSKKGRLTLQRCPDTGTLITIEEGCGSESKDILIPVFKNGVLLKDYTLDEIRERIDAYSLDNTTTV
ncbi:unnamed protein product [Heterobilharzia americana]|nr:unnamed protein product [Heterobilharzia americana]CAH8501940.1 unnamed protein product [Heterobilharzia americana]